MSYRALQQTDRWSDIARSIQNEFVPKNMGSIGPWQVIYTFASYRRRCKYTHRYFSRCRRLANTLSNAMVLLYLIYICGTYTTRQPRMSHTDFALGNTLCLSVGFGYFFSPLLGHFCQDLWGKLQHNLWKLIRILSTSTWNVEG